MTKPKYVRKNPKLTSDIDIRLLLTGLVAELTVDAYATSWRAYAEFEPNFQKAIQAKTLVAWRQHMIQHTKLATATINLRIRSIRAIGERLYRRDIINRDTYYDLREVEALPDNALPGRRRPFNRTKLEPEQVRALCKAPDVTQNDLIAIRDRAMLFTLATTGARISEVCKMKVNDIKPVAGGSSYVVTNILGKGQSEVRSAPLSKEAYEAIMDWVYIRPVSSEYIFTVVDDSGFLGILYSDRHISRSVALAHIKRYSDATGIEHVKAHDLRRFVGTQIIKKNGIRVAQKVLGHSNIQTTARYYDLEDLPEGVSEGLF